MVKFKGLDIDPRKISESVTVKPSIQVESGQAFKEATSDGGLRYLLPRIEAIHAGTTRNNTRYPAEKLRGSQELGSGVYSWMHPYPKPVIYNHDTDTEASGRIQTAAFAEYTTAGRPGIIVVPKITQEQAIDDILGGRLLTVSIGATTDAAICSVCGTDIINDGFCGHYKGETFDGVKAEWIVGNVWFDELSWVNVPADQDAMIIDSGGVISTAESFAFDGRDILNLGKNTTEWLVDSQTALAEGLEPTNKKGDTTLLTEQEIKQLQDDLKEAQDAKAALEAEKTALEADKEVLTQANEQLKTDMEDTVAAKTTAEEALTQKEAELAEKETEGAAFAATKESLEAEKTALEESLAQEKEAQTSLVEENARLSTDMHKVLAERVVDLRVSLGKEADRDEALVAYVSRSTESLNDSLGDLLKEASKAPAASAARGTLSIEHPAAGAIATKATTVTTERTTEEVLASLFRGPNSKTQ